MPVKWKTTQTVLVIYALFVLLFVGVVHTSDGPTLSAPHVQYAGNSNMAGSFPQSNATVTYITGNFSIGKESVLKYENTSLMVENISSESVSILVYGALFICNSTMDMSTGNSSAVKQIFIYGEPGSEISIENSKLAMSGQISLCYSKLSIYHSNLTADGLSSSNPYYDTLRLVSNHSSVSVISSSIGGLLSYSKSTSFRVAAWSSTITNFSQNSTVPLNESNVADYNAFIDRGEISFEYYGKKPGNNDSIKIYSGNSTIKYVYLNVSSQGETRAKNVSFNFPVLHRAGWFKQSPDFRIYLTDHFSDPVAVSNLTVSLFSNDTATLYPDSIFNYVISNSSFISLNSTIDLNEVTGLLCGKIINPEKNSLVAYQSKIYWINSMLNDSTSYRSSPFLNIQSEIYLFRILRIVGTYEGRTVANFNPTIVEGSSVLQNLTDQVNLQIGVILKANGTHPNYGIFALYGFSNESQNFTYTGNYMVEFHNLSMNVSLPPYPIFGVDTLDFDLHVNVPVVRVNLRNVELVSEGNSFIKFNVTVAGSLSGNGTMKVALTKSSFHIPSFVFSLNKGISGSYNELVHLPENVSPAYYHMLMKFNYNGAYIINTSNPINASEYVFPNVSLSISGNATLKNSDILVHLRILENGTFHISNANLEISEYDGNFLVGTANFNLTLGRDNYSLTMTGVTDHITRVNATIFTSFILLNHGNNYTSVVIPVHYPKHPVSNAPFMPEIYTFVILSSALVGMVLVYSYRRFMHTHYVCNNCGKTHRGRWSQCSCQQTEANHVDHKPRS